MVGHLPSISHINLRTAENHDRIAARMPITYSHYRALHTTHTTRHLADRVIESDTTGPYRLAEIVDDIRNYQKV
ncbi:hypothetical protein [Nocardia pseudobrasiliensis]|uniref:Uncharacterized protein n=1 Tax=Nocardia pseudobrasiliensis TaxID=45979 RepID=A0A370HZI7_9NOCA|nr:hypothetical protein [Nocardia pseudobrasiliensis]RDI63906.1 hypothetical protein DFR76_109246 [Nocardia pseudobrasiliensis]